MNTSARISASALLPSGLQNTLRYCVAAYAVTAIKMM
jgi:hypothetical protein